MPRAIQPNRTAASLRRWLCGWLALLSVLQVAGSAWAGVRSFSSLLTNLRVSRKLGSDAELTLDVFNLFDRKVNDIQYFYESQLPGEAGPVADRHVHPAEPRTARLSLRMQF